MPPGSECSSAMLSLRNNRRPQAFPKCAPAATDRLATARCATRPGARQHSLPDAEKFGGEVHGDHLLVGANNKERYHASHGRSVTHFTVVRWRNGLLLLLRVRAAESVQVFGCRHDETIGALKRPATEKRQGTKSRREVVRRRRHRLWGFSRAV